MQITIIKLNTALKKTLVKVHRQAGRQGQEFRCPPYCLLGSRLMFTLVSSDCLPMVLLLEMGHVGLNPFWWKSEVDLSLLHLQEVVVAVVPWAGAAAWALFQMSAAAPMLSGLRFCRCTLAVPWAQLWAWCLPVPDGRLRCCTGVRLHGSSRWRWFMACLHTAWTTGILLVCKPSH